MVNKGALPLHRRGGGGGWRVGGKSGEGGRKGESESTPY